MNRLNMLLVALMTTTVVVAQTDTTTVKGEQLDEIVVNANNAQRRLSTVQIGAEQIQVKDLTSKPVLFGEADIMRSVQLLPGVKAESDASSSFQVRGGTSAQNTILYDDAPVYNVGHLAGLFSAFNDEALATATLYKGLIPAQYEGKKCIFKATNYYADFTYMRDGKLVVEDVKGFKTKEYQLKKKMMYYFHHIKIKET